MKAFWIPALIALAAGPVLAEASPQEPAAAQQDAARADRLEGLLEEYSDAMKAFRQAYGAAATDQEKRKVYEETYPNAADWFPRLWTFVEERPGDEASGEALVWIVQNDRADEDAARAAGVLLSDHIGSETLGEVCFTYSRRVKDGRTFLETVLAKSPHRAVRASARFWLAVLMLQEVEYAEQLTGDDEESAGGYRDYLGAEVAGRLTALDIETTRKTAETLLVTVQRDDPDVEHPYKESLGVAAEAILFELHNLVVGKVAPDIEGEDLDGVPFKLSDYRGKVVVLDFWGNW